MPFRRPVIVVVSVSAGVAPPLEEPAKPFEVATDTAVTVPVVATVHPSALPEASTPRAKLPAVQLVPFAARAVAVPAFPDTLPVMVLENVLLPPKVLLFVRSVEEAAVMVLLSPRLKVVPFTITDEF